MWCTWKSGTEVNNGRRRRAVLGLLALAFVWILISGMGIRVQAAARVMEDGSIFDPSWYAAQYKDAAAAGGSDAVRLYRYYQLYGQGLGEKPYDVSAVGQTALARLQKNSAKVIAAKKAAYGDYAAAWDAVTTRVYDTDSVKVWHSEYLVPDSMTAKLQQAIAEFEKGGYALGFVLVDLKTGDAVSYHAGDVIYSASVIKAPYIFSVLEAGNEPTKDMFLAGNLSDNDAYRRMRDQYGNEVFARWVQGTNVPEDQTTTRYINTTPLDLCRMFYKGTGLLLGNETYSDWARNTFTDSLNSAIALTVGGSGSYSAAASDTESAGSGDSASESSLTGSVNGTKKTSGSSSAPVKPVYSKAGWIASGTDNSYTNAAVVGGDYPYVVAVMSDAPGYKGLEYAQNLMPVLDAFHDEMVDPSKAGGANVKAVEEFANSAVSSVEGNK